MAGGATSVDIADLTTNGITVSNVTGPTLTSATYNSSTGLLSLTGTNFVKELGATNDITQTHFTITGEGGGTYTLTGAAFEITDATSASVTLSNADKLRVNGLLNKDGTNSDTSNTLYNLAAAASWMPGAAPSVNQADITNGITVSGSANPAITSATYNAATGALAVTGTRFATQAGGNEVTLTTLTLTGQGSGTYTLTTTAASVSSETAFSATLNDADKLALRTLLNKNGTNADDNTLYNVAAADNWMVPGGYLAKYC